MLALYVIIAYGLMNASFKLIDLLPSARFSTGSAGAPAPATTAAIAPAARRSAGISRLGAVRIGARARRSGAGS